MSVDDEGSRSSDPATLDSRPLTDASSTPILGEVFEGQPGDSDVVSVTYDDVILLSGRDDD